MDTNEILRQVTKIFQDVLDDDEIIIKEEFTANDIEDWDSLTHILLVVAIEKHFTLRFTSSEIGNWANIGEMCIAIKNKLK